MPKVHKTGQGDGILMGELKGLVYYGPKELVTAQVSNPNSNGDFTTDIRGIANPQRYTINSKGRVYLPLPIIVTPELAEVAVCRVDGQVCGAALKWDWYPPLDKDPAPGPQYTIWGIRTRVIEPVPRLILDSNSRTRGERKFRFEVLPTTYPAYSVVSEFYEDGHLMVKASHSGMPLEAHQYTLITGGLSFLNPGGLHNTRVIVNDGWHWPFQGKDIPLSIYSQPVNVPVVRVDIKYSQEEMRPDWVFNRDDEDLETLCTLPDGPCSDIRITTTPPTEGLPLIFCSTRLADTPDGLTPPQQAPQAGHNHGPAAPEMTTPPLPLRFVTLPAAGDPVRNSWGGFSSPVARTASDKRLEVATLADGTRWVRYNAPLASGKQIVVMEVDPPTVSGAVVAGAQFEQHLDVLVPGLQWMGDGTYHVLTPNVAGVHDDEAHPGEHYLTAEYAQPLRDIAERYYNECGQHRLQLNDMSLEWGGMFEFAGTWLPTRHAIHRKGRNCDIGWVQFTSDSQKTCLETILVDLLGKVDLTADKSNCTWFSENNNHYHLGCGTNSR